MSRVAFYIRMSGERQVESPEVQIETCRAFMHQQKLTGDGEPIIYRDNALSRSEYKKRPQLYAMINAAERGEFSVLIIRDIDRLGSDQNRNGVIVSEMIDRGVVIWEYRTREQVRQDSALAKIMASLKSFAAEIEVEKVRSRTRDALASKAAKGLNVGGKCYGYANERIMEGERHDHTEYRIDAKQAEIVRLIFARYAAGAGLKKIARELNAQGLPSPQAGSRGTGTWGPSAIQPMLRRERYRGVATWGKVAKGYKLGTKVRETREKGDSEIVIAEAPRIIPEDLWFAVQARIADNAHGRQDAKGREGNGRPARHLLSGIAKCSQCGGPIVANTSRWGKERIGVYQCAWAKQRGPEVCTNRMLRPMATVNAVVIDWLTETVLTPEFVLRLVADLSADTKKTEPPMQDGQDAEAKKLRKEIDRLVSALAILEDKPDAILRQIADRQKRLKEIEGEIAAAKAEPKIAEKEIARIGERLYAALKSLTATLKNNPQEARAVIASLFPRLTFTPTETRSGTKFLISGVADIGCLSAVEANFASPTGFEPVLAA